MQRSVTSGEKYRAVRVTDTHCLNIYFNKRPPNHLIIICDAAPLRHETTDDATGLFI